MSILKVNNIQPASGDSVSITGLTLSGLGLISGSSIASSEQGSIALTTNDVAASAIDIGLNTDDSPQFAGINLGHASDTTLTRASAGVLAVEGTNVQLQVAEGAFVDGDKTKLDGIEANATADQTASEIRTLVEAATDSNVFTDADHTKLNGIEASADVTDTANVTAAGALMDSEVDADIKTLSLPANTTISAFGKTLVDDADASAARTTLGVDAAGTDNSTDVTLVTTSHNYLSLSGQAITLGQIDISDDTNLAVTDTTGQTGIDLTLSGDTLSGTVSGLGTGNDVQFANLTLTGDLTVQGTTTTINSTAVEIADVNILLASGSADSAAANGAGLTVAGADATFTYTHSGTKWNMNKALDMGANTITTTGAIAGATLNTGQGANELYAMNQAVQTTDDVRFDSLGIGTAASGTTGEIRATGDITAFYSSDERLKENIVPLTGALEKVKALRGVTFEWKELSEADKKSIHSHEGTDIGVIAQDIQAQYPELVHQRAHGFLSVDYQKLSAVLIEAVKELSKKVELLESKI